MTNSDMVSEMLSHVREIDEMGELPLAARRRLIDHLMRRMDDLRAVRFRVSTRIDVRKEGMAYMANLHSQLTPADGPRGNRTLEFRNQKGGSIYVLATTDGSQSAS